MTDDELEARYEPKIKRLFRDICDEALERGDYHCMGPDAIHNDEFQWRMVLVPADQEPEDAGVDVAITIAESGPRGDEPGGVNFAMDVTSYQGEIVGGLVPYNYTPDVWVDRNDVDAVDNRWDVFQNGSDPGAILDSIEEWHEKQRKPQKPTLSAADLETINRHRRGLGMEPIDPGAGWTADELRQMADTIRREGRMFNPVSQTVMELGGTVAELLRDGPLSKDALVRVTDTSPQTIQRALEYLRDRGVWITFDTFTNEWGIMDAGVDWRDVALPRVFEAGMLPAREYWVLRAKARSLNPAPRKVERVAGELARMMVTTGGVNRIEVSRRLGVSPPTTYRSIRYLRDQRRVPVQYSDFTKEHSLPPATRDWRTVTLGELYDAGSIPVHEQQILDAAVQSLPEASVRRKVAANPRQLKRRLLR